jgi:hypothetical protein
MDPLGNTADPRAVPVQDTTARESQVKEELSGWFARKCDLNAQTARKSYALYSTPGYDGTVDLAHQYQSGEAMEKMQTWEKRAASARRGVLLMDNAAQRDPAFLADPATHYVRPDQERFDAAVNWLRDQFLS